VQYREGVRHVAIVTNSKYRANCGVEYGLQTSLEIGRKSDKHEVAVIEPEWTSETTRERKQSL